MSNYEVKIIFLVISVREEIINVYPIGLVLLVKIAVSAETQAWTYLYVKDDNTKPIYLIVQFLWQIANYKQLRRRKILNILCCVVVAFKWYFS